ncbi:hypothetical protein CURTO8I2_180079 [Curtobacterium sp. 8I-2]|nr:hypothetical protein CURTO8I2_180079 [Curtobacterium sp. 8I-2]
MRELPARTNEVAGVAVRVLLEVVLVLVLGLPERAGRGDLGDDLAGPDARRIDVGDGVERDLLLLVGRVEDGRTVAATDVVALAVLRRRVVDLEEELQQVPVRDPGRVEDDLDRLGVVAVVAVRRVRHVAAGVADAGADDAGTTTEELLRSPEASAGEDGGLGGGHGGLLGSRVTGCDTVWCNRQQGRSVPVVRSAVGRGPTRVCGRYDSTLRVRAPCRPCATVRPHEAVIRARRGAAPSAWFVGTGARALFPRVPRGVRDDRLAAGDGRRATGAVHALRFRRDVAVFVRRRGDRAVPRTAGRTHRHDHDLGHRSVRCSHGAATGSDASDRPRGHRPDLRARRRRDRSVDQVTVVKRTRRHTLPRT